ncbi:protein monoglycylase TTLL8 [Tenrec ecaudatus]|uniref:protein monoglycylase TTLL8 n=1 Tax=Tenrec ecaudatus TaxID=94439 RepID=UPI003F59F58D
MAPSIRRPVPQPRAWEPGFQLVPCPWLRPSLDATVALMWPVRHRAPRGPRRSPGCPPAPAQLLTRPRSPTPRAGRRKASCAARRRVHRHSDLRAARGARATPRPVALGNRRTRGSAAGGGGAARAAGLVPGTRALGARRGEGPVAREALEMEPGDRKRVSSACSQEDRTEGHKLKRGNSQDLVLPPKLDRYRIAKQLTEKAIKEKKIFSICGHYPVVRAALRRKGWVEKKFHFLPKASLPGEDGSAEPRENLDLTLDRTEDIHDVMSRLVKNEAPYFLWTIKRDVIDFHSLSCEQMLNHYGKTASFTTKIGLCMSMRSLPWYVQANPDTFFPRCYSLRTASEKQDFLDDFRRTVASSILKWVVSHQSCKAKPRSRPEEVEVAAGDSDSRRSKDAENTGTKLPTGLSGQLIDAACKVCQAYLGQVSHEDIDISGDDAELLTEEEWNDLTQQYYSLVHGDAFISSSQNYLSQCQNLLNRIASINPQMEIDGIRNIWIIKPAAKSRGRDIVCMDRVEEILDLVAEDPLTAKDHKWVAQKYIETPLLIYDTKFDIRQWFLVTDWNPLTIWFYKESYLRFSTQRFSLDKLDSAIHLCNNSIQKHLKNAKGRSPLLPCHNMWTSTKFQEYLQRRGRGSVWGSIIYPSMKRAIANTMQVAQDHVEARRNSFELYGADFILGKDFRPWLIEINSSPTMHPSTPVTAQLCAQVQEDTLKVVVDRKLDRNCDIGNFELLWRQPVVELPPFSGSDLCVEGVSFKKARKPGLSISPLRPSASPSGTRTPKARCPPAAACEPARGPLPVTLPQDLRGKAHKVVCCAFPALPSRGLLPDLPAFRLQCARQPPRATLAPPLQPLVWKAHPTAPRGRKAMDGPHLQLPRAPGPRDVAAPCLVCCGPFQPAQPCKRCRSFCAAVLQGASFVPLGGGHGGGL